MITPSEFPWFCKLLFTKKCLTGSLNLAFRKWQSGKRKPEREHIYVANALQFCDMHLQELQLTVTCNAVNRQLQHV